MVIRLKKGLCFFLAVILVFSLFACSKKETYTPYSLSQEILALCGEEIKWKSLDSDSAATYYGAGKQLLENFAAYISDDDARYDAVAIFAFENEQEKKAIADCFTENIKSNKATAGVVNAAESAKIEKGVIIEFQNMLILIVTENSGEVAKELLKMGAKHYIQ